MSSLIKRRLRSARVTDFKVAQKPWGEETLLILNDKYAVKNIKMRAPARSSMQYHQKKQETIIVLEGEIELEISDGKETFVETFVAGQVYTILPDLIHRVRVLKDCELLEVSSPEIEDVIRLADDYGRN